MRAAAADRAHLTVPNAGAKPEGQKCLRGMKVSPGCSEEWGPLQAEGPVRGTVTPAGVFITRDEERPKFRVTRFTEHPCAYRKAVFTQTKAANKH